MADKTSLETRVTEKSHSTGTKSAINIGSIVLDPTLYVEKKKKKKEKKLKLPIGVYPTTGD